jgi:hypothetical protein
LSNFARNLPAVTSGGVQQNFDALNGRLGAVEGKLLGPTEWVAVPFTANWRNYEAGFPKCAYRKGADGRVYLRGLAQPAATGQNALFTLPDDFRPTSQGANGPGFACVAGNGAGDIISRTEVLPSGVVIPGTSFAGTTGAYYLFLDTISFYPE